MQKFRIHGKTLNYCGLTEDKRGIQVPHGVVWTFPWFKMNKTSAYAHEVACLESYAPVEIKRVCFEVPDLTRDFPQTVKTAYDKQRDYYHAVGYEEHCKQYPDDCFSREEFEHGRQLMLSRTCEDFAQTPAARRTAWLQHGNDQIAEEHGYRGFAFELTIRESLKRLGYESWEAGGVAISNIKYAVVYDDPDETVIYLKGLKEEQQSQPATYTRVATTAAQPVLRKVGNVFAKSGTVWRVVFDGKPEFHIEDTLGAKYLDCLLHRPNAAIRAFDLERAVRPEKQGVRIENSIHMTVDAKTRQEVREELRALRAEIEEAHASCSTEKVQRLQAEIASMEAVIAGEPLIGGDTGERARNNVRKAIGKVLKKLREGNKHEQAFGMHITRFVSLGYEVIYNAPERVSWQ